MSHTSLNALYSIVISLGLAVIFNFLFFEKAFGISVLIFVAILLGTVLLLRRDQKLSIENTWLLSGAILFFALMASIRANEFLMILNLCATFGLLLLLAEQLTGTPTFLLKLSDYILYVILSPFRMMKSGLSSLALASHMSSDVKNKDTWIRVIKGVLMALPILLIFAVLFSQADLAFSKFINNFITIRISENTAQYTALLFFAFVAVFSFLSYLLSTKTTSIIKTETLSTTLSKPGRNIEVLVFLSLIALLFLVFIGFQITYLLGGETNVIDAGFTYAEYARRGFWELLAVAALSLVVLFAADKYNGGKSKDNKYFLIPSLILIAEVLVIITSAFKRLSLYIDTYSLSTPRFYAAVLILFITVLFLLLAIKFIRSKEEEFFIFGTLLSLIAFLVIVNFINPDAVIARSNINQYVQTGKIDLLHIGELSADAESLKIELYKKLQGEDKETLRELLQKEKIEVQKDSAHWESSNLTRVKALKLLQELE